MKKGILRKMHKDNKGFTLIELMIVVAIIGILAAIAIPQFAAYRIRGFNASALSDTRNLSTTEAALFADWQAYGISFTGVAIPGLGNTAVAATTYGAAVVGPSSPTDGITTDDSGANPRGINISVGNSVSVFAGTAINNSTFLGGGKHLQGDTFYAADSDTTSIYQDQSGTVGVAMLVTDIPAAITAGDDLTGVGTWVAK